MTYVQAYGVTEEVTGFKYAYDAENRLISVEPKEPQDGDKKEEYEYDYMGRRVKKNISTYSGGLWSLTMEKQFVYDGWNLIKEYTTVAGTTDDTKYVHGLDVSGTRQGAGGIGGLIARVNEEDGTHLYAYDGNGNVTQLVNALNGVISANYRYDPFGKTLLATGAMADKNPFRFSTKYFDEFSGLYYFGYRYYSPDLGRWLSRDPLEELGSKILRNERTDLELIDPLYKIALKQENDINLYSFNLNNPATRIDPFGLASYQVYWSLTADSAFGNMRAKVSGIVVDMEMNKKCNYDAVDFKGKFRGLSYDAIPISGTFNNNETFEDGMPWPDVTRVQGRSKIITGSIAFHKWGKSGGGYQFGSLRGTKTSISDAEGFDLSVSILFGNTFTIGEVYEMTSPYLLD